MSIPGKYPMTILVVGDYMSKTLAKNNNNKLFPVKVVAVYTCCHNLSFGDVLHVPFPSYGCSILFFSSQTHEDKGSESEVACLMQQYNDNFITLNFHYLFNALLYFHILQVQLSYIDLNRWEDSI